MSDNQTNEFLELIPFSFPLFGFSCEAENLEKAQEKLNNFINPPKKK